MLRKKVLEKANLGGIVPMVKLGKKGEFDVWDSDKCVRVIYAGGAKELFDEEIGIFNLGLLLDILKTMAEPKISYKDGVLTLKEGGKTFEYLTADPGVVYTAHKKEKGESKAVIATTIYLSVEQIKDILKGASVLKDASIVIIEGNSINIGGENENKYQLKLEKGAAVARIILPKKAFQAVLSACEGEVTIGIRPDGAPVVVEEKDLVYIINQQE